MNIAFGQPQFAAGAEIGRHGAELQRTFGNIIDLQQLPDGSEHPIAAQQTAALPGKIHQTNDVPIAERPHPLLHHRQTVTGECRPHQCTDRAAGNDINLNPQFL
ncbi:rab-like gtpase activating protein [Lasius niger]|uniref:Rab-like gtpase activating protein n=1 Tax=Lasius niger TaxID=67767 RepID=A0A0J7JW99_LASNI|nr:rab-like gtpase activating protein [Lasius niger]